MLALDGVSGVTFNNNTSQASAGVVLQVVSSVPLSTNFTTTSQSYADTGITASITPKFATSKILVTINFLCAAYRSASNQSGYGTNKLLRGATALLTDISFPRQYILAAGSSSNALIMVPATMTYYDSPNTTNSTTYKLQAYADTAGDTYAIYSAMNSITLTEIAA